MLIHQVGEKNRKCRRRTRPLCGARKPRPSEPELPSGLGPESRSIPSASQSAFWRQRGPLHFESQSTSFSSHRPCINAVVFLKRSEKSDHQNAIYVLNQGNRPVPLALILKTTRPPFKMLAFGCAFFTSSGVFQSVVSAIASQASYCARAALIPLWPARDLK